MSNSSLFTPALLRTYSFVFLAVHESHSTFLSPFISNSSRRVSSFFLRVQLSQPYVATGHSSAFISFIFVEKSVCCDFSIFSAVMPRSPALCLTWYGIPSYTHHLLQSGTQGTGTYLPTPVRKSSTSLKLAADNPSRNPSIDFYHLCTNTIRRSQTEMGPSQTGCRVSLISCVMNADIGR